MAWQSDAIEKTTCQNAPSFLRVFAISNTMNNECQDLTPVPFFIVILSPVGAKNLNYVTRSVIPSRESEKGMGLSESCNSAL